MITAGLKEKIVQSLTLWPVGSCLITLNVVLLGRGFGSVVTLGPLRSGVMVRGLNLAELRTWWSLSCKVRCEGGVTDWPAGGGDWVLVEVASDWDRFVGHCPLLCLPIITLCLATSLSLSAVPAPVRVCLMGSTGGRGTE